MSIDQLNEELAAALAKEAKLEKEDAGIRAARELEIERAKLRASGWTSLAVNLVTVGVFAQIASLLYFGKPEGLELGITVVIMLGCTIVALYLHWQGQDALTKGYDL